MFAFLNPLATSVWSFMFVAYTAVSLSMFFLARFSPYEWRPHTEDDCRESRFTISNCFWFVAGVSLKQDAGITPKVKKNRICFALYKPRRAACPIKLRLGKTNWDWPDGCDYYYYIYFLHIYTHVSDNRGRHAGIFQYRKLAFLF